MTSFFLDRDFNPSVSTFFYGKNPRDYIVTLLCDSCNESSAWQVYLNFQKVLESYTELLPFGCRASSGSAILNLLESSFPGIGSDGLGMNRLFACSVGNESVCSVVDMQAKVLLL